MRGEVTLFGPRTEAPSTILPARFQKPSTPADGPWLCRQLDTCRVCGALPGAFCTRVESDGPTLLAHRGRR